MGWPEVMNELEDKILGTIKGSYYPLDGIPFFRLQYPPELERDALRKLKQLAMRLHQNDVKTKYISLTNVLKETLVEVLGSDREKILEKLLELESEWRNNRYELMRKLTLCLAEDLPDKTIKSLDSLGKRDVAILVRSGALYPFLRSSTILSRLINRVNCVIVFAYPGRKLGGLLDSSPYDLHGGDYRGETIYWH